MNSKKTYCKPTILSYQIDREISLAMQSDTEGGPPDPMQAKPQEKQKNPFDSNPFGSTKKK